MYILLYTSYSQLLYTSLYIQVLTLCFVLWLAVTSVNLGASFALARAEPVLILHGRIALLILQGLNPTIVFVG